MAKIKFGMMMTDARGKLGGQVFSKNRSGSYVRTKVTPVNPRTIAQQANRGLLGSISAGWSGLDEAQRNAWNAAVEAWQKTNVFGDLQKPTGKNLFTGLNKVRVSQFPALPIQLLPPVKQEFIPFVLVGATYTSASGIFTIQFSGESLIGRNFQVRATGALSVGTSYFANLLRGLGSAVAGSEGTQLIITSQYQNTFGSVAVGNKIGFEVREVFENGQLGVPVVYSVIAS